MTISRGLFGWSPPHTQPLSPISELPESPSPYLDISIETSGGAPQAADVDDEEEIDDPEDLQPPPAAVPFSRLFAYADRLDWLLMVTGSVAGAAHGTALVVYLHYFAKVVDGLRPGATPEEHFT